MELPLEIYISTSMTETMKNGQELTKSSFHKLTEVLYCRQHLSANMPASYRVSDRLCSKLLATGDNYLLMTKATRQ